MNLLLNLEYARKTLQAYEKMSKPLCLELGIPQTAFDILMFLANNPEHNTAKDVVELRNMKANLVSINVDKLVREGFLERGNDPSDRRKIILTCTKKAEPIITRGRTMQRQFGELLLRGVSPEALASMQETFQIIANNIEEMRSELS